MRMRGNHLQYFFYSVRQAAQRFQASDVRIKLRLVRQLAVHQKIGNLFEAGIVSEIIDIVSAVGQTGTFLAYCAQCSFAGDYACQATRFLVRCHDRSSFYRIQDLPRLTPCSVNS